MGFSIVNQPWGTPILGNLHFGDIFHKGIWDFRQATPKLHPTAARRRAKLGHNTKSQGNLKGFADKIWYPTIDQAVSMDWFCWEHLNRKP